MIMNSRKLTVVAFLFLGLLVPFFTIWEQKAETHAESVAGLAKKSVTNFTLLDFRGKKHSLSDFKSSKVVVIAVLGTECPLAKLYAPRLAALEKAYKKKGVAFIGIDANVQDSLTEIAAYARVHKIRFPILKDLGNKVVDALGAKRTPEVFVLDARRTVRYWGRIDDQYGVGYVREKANIHFLKDAIDQLLSGKKIVVASSASVGCHIGRVKIPKENAKVTYANQISRLLQKRCVECHRSGEIAPFSLTDYDEVVGWAEMIEEVVLEQRMPPWHANPKHGKFQNDRLLSKEEKAMIVQWVADGAPLGDVKQIPKPKKYVTGWQLPRKPDMEFFIQKKPFKVAAEGEIAYQWFSIDPKLTEDKWLHAAEIMPGNHLVVHHILAFIRMPDGSKSFGGGGGFLVGYVPGLRVSPYPKGMAKFIPKGAHIAFQVHYTPVGSEQFDQSKIGLVFADEKEITHEVMTTRAAKRRLEIPPHAGNHRVEATSKSVPINVQLLGMMPHMHLRGKSFRYEAMYANGKSEILLDIPAYDFNWQTGYQLVKPKNFPPGTRMRCIAHYDNSSGNLNNPNPSKVVEWGDQTWEEMMIGYFDIAVPAAIAKAYRAGAKKKKPRSAKEKAERIFKKYDANKDGKIYRKELPKKAKAYFDQLDENKDGVLLPAEVERGVKKL